jgi:hypothetical protein
MPESKNAAVSRQADAPSGAISKAVSGRAGEKPKRSTTAPASAVRRAQVADRDAKFIEYIKRADIQEKMNELKPPKRMSFLIKSFKEETDITMPPTMAYRAWHKACGAIKIKKDIPEEKTLKFSSDDDTPDLDEGAMRQSPDNGSARQGDTISETPMVII